MIELSAAPPPAPRAKLPAAEQKSTDLEARETEESRDSDDSERSEAETSFVALLALMAGVPPAGGARMPGEGAATSGKGLPSGGNALPPGEGAPPQEALDTLELIPLARAASALLGSGAAAAGAGAPLPGGTEDLLRQSLVAPGGATGSDAGRAEGQVTFGTTSTGTSAPAGETRGALGTAAASLLPLAVDDPEFDQALGRRMIAMVQQGASDARVRVHPEHLGPIDIRLKVDGDSAQVTLSSPHASVRETLEQALPRLREVFGEAGVNLAQADVNDQQANSSGAGAHGDREAASARGPHDPAADAQAPDEPAMPRAQLGPVRLLDTFA